MRSSWRNSAGYAEEIDGTDIADNEASNMSIRSLVHFQEKSDTFVAVLLVDLAVCRARS